MIRIFYRRLKAHEVQSSYAYPRVSHTTLACKVSAREDWSIDWIALVYSLLNARISRKNSRDGPSYHSESGVTASLPAACFIKWPICFLAEDSVISAGCRSDPAKETSVIASARKAVNNCL